MRMGFRTKWPVSQSRTRRGLIRLILLSLLTLSLIMSQPWAVYSQVPSMPSSDKEIVNQPRKFSGQIGNLLYAPIKIDGRPIFLIAVPSNNVQAKDDKSLSPLEDRVDRIENNIQEVIKRGFDPNTLQVYSSVLNGQQVILASDQKHFKPLTIGTITQADADLFGQSIDTIAPEATKILRTALIRAREERQPEALKKESILALQIFLGIVMLSLIFIGLQRLALNRINYLKELLLEFQNQTQQQAEARISNYHWLSKNRNVFLKIGDRVIFFIYWFAFKQKLKTDGEKTQNLPENYPNASISQFIQNPAQFLTLEQVRSLLLQQINIAFFLRRLLIFGQLFLWLRGTALILSVFPYSREVGFNLTGAPASLLSICLAVLLMIKIIELLINGSLKAWLDHIHLIEKDSSRQAIRVPTIINTLQNVNITCCVSIGILLSLAVFDIPITTVLAGAGILGFAVSFGSQSLIKDLIAGVINLANDAYTVGDVVVIGNDSGLVENMNLFVTRIRSVNGDLITITNGSVGTVRNQSKDWSRVDYQIQVSYETDINKALNILLFTAQELSADPQWNSLVLESPELKGVEDISHQGVIIRIWLKTKPGEQWTVTRELRFRIKEAFEKAGINIGIPQQAFLWQNATDSNESNPSFLKGSLTADHD